jgi:hypothetical protein
MRPRPIVIIMILILGLLLTSGCLAGLAAAQSTRMILALGSAGFLDDKSIQAATGAEVKRDLDGSQLKDFSVVVLANIAFPALPEPVRQGLTQYVNDGGSLLITGGSQSFGSGGYDAVASIIPFQIRAAGDWRFIPFRPPVPLQPGHPILAGVTFITVGNLNDMNPRGDALEILRAAGGGSAAGRVTGGIGPGGVPGIGGTGGGSYPSPLIAELNMGAGRVIGIAFDLNEFSGMPDRDLFVRNTIGYLLRASRIAPTR